MIHEIDGILQGLVTDEVLVGTDIEVAFDAPTKEWSARRNAPTVNLFLFDVRENVELRHEGHHEELDADGLVVALREPPRYYTLSYLVTAWTNRPQDEHRLLSVLLTGLSLYPTLPHGRLVGSLATLGLTVPMTVSVPPVQERGLAEIWTALGGALKPSLDLVVTAPMAGLRSPAAGPVTDALVLSTVDGDRRETSSLRYTDPEVGAVGDKTGVGPGGDSAAGDQTCVSVGARRVRGTPTHRAHRAGNPIPNGHR